jgi:hypothetical protein
VLIWTSYAAFVSSQRYSLNALTAWLIPNAQNLLLAKFYWCARAGRCARVAARQPGHRAGASGGRGPS